MGRFSALLAPLAFQADSRIGASLRPWLFWESCWWMRRWTAGASFCTVFVPPQLRQESNATSRIFFGTNLGPPGFGLSEIVSRKGAKAQRVGGAEVCLGIARLFVEFPVVHFRFFARSMTLIPRRRLGLV